MPLLQHIGSSSARGFGFGKTGLSYFRTINEIASINDVVASFLGRVNNIEETGLILDNVDPNLIVQAPAQETAAAADSVSLETARNGIAVETAVVADLVDNIGTLNRNITETSTAADTAVASTPALIPEVALTIDQTIVSAIRVGQVSETSTATDSIAGLKISSGSVFEPTVAVDQVSAEQTLRSQITEATVGTDQVAYDFTPGPVDAVAMVAQTTSSAAVGVWKWLNPGFGTKFTNPSETSNYGVAFTASGNAIAIARAISPFIAAYPWSGGGFGTRYSAPSSTPAGVVYRVAFSPAEDAIALCHLNSPYISIYQWSTSGFGTKYSNPATLPGQVTVSGYGVAFNSYSDQIAIASSGSPYITAYPWDWSTGFGTKYANPSSGAPSSAVFGVDFSPSSDAIAIGRDQLLVYEFSGAGFGTKYANAASSLGSNCRAVKFSPANDAILVCTTGTPYVHAYQWDYSSGIGSRFTGTGVSTGLGKDCAFNQAGDAAVFAITGSQMIVAYPWNASTGFGTKYSDPTSKPTGYDAWGVAFSQ